MGERQRASAILDQGTVGDRVSKLDRGDDGEDVGAGAEVD